MRTFIACAGINGSETALEKLINLMKERQPDSVLFAGGIAAPAASTSQRVGFIKHSLEGIGRTGQRFFFIPGASDAPLADFLGASLNAEITFPSVAAAQATLFLESEVALTGIGGLITEADDATAPLIKYSHSSAEYYLRMLWKTDKPTKILLFSEPTTGRLGGNKGNHLVDEFIKSYHPNLCIAPAGKEARGMAGERHGFTVNPGMLTENSAAWIDWQTRQVEFLDL
jgi:Icc-related predicted phosphoesterase